jgi:hypothetical protein
LAALALAPAIVQAQVEAAQLREADVQHGKVAARAIGGSVSSPTLEVESAAVTVTLPSGKPYPGYLISAYEPESGLSWWTFQGAGPGDPEDRISNLPAGLTFFVSEREIVGVELGTAPPALWVLRSGARAASLEAGRERAIEQLVSSARRIEQGTARWMRTVSLMGALPRDFYYQVDRAMPPLELTVTSIARRPGGWTVSLEGREGRKAEVLVDELFVLEGARELTPPPES